MITVKTWKEIVSFDPLANGVFNVDGTVKLIAEVRNMSIEEVEQLPMEDLLPTFIQCVNEVSDLVFSKVGKKNEIAEKAK